MSGSTENKLVKIAMDASVIIGIAAAVGYVSKKALKESFLNDPSSSLTNYGKWVLILGSSMYLKDYLEKTGVLPKSV